MTTHAWAERAAGVWTLEIRFDSDNENTTTGEFFEWTLVLHGTKNPSYTDQIPLKEHEDRSKLYLVKKIHENNFQGKKKFVELLRQDEQHRLGSDENELMKM